MFESTAKYVYLFIYDERTYNTIYLLKKETDALSLALLSDIIQSKYIIVFK